MVLSVIAREHRDRGDLVDNKVARIRVRALFTGLLRFTRNDKRVCLARDDTRKKSALLARTTIVLCTLHFKLCTLNLAL